jgi:hypothetical protein
VEFVDDIFEDFSLAFRGELVGASPVAPPEFLNRSRLNYSADSLTVVDEYLESLRRRARRRA